MSRNDQQPTCGNGACVNQRLTIKHCLRKCLDGGITEKIQYLGDFKTLLERDCEVKEMK